MAGVAFALLPTANRIQGCVEFICQILLRIVVVFADILKSFSYHRLTPIFSIGLFVT